MLNDDQDYEIMDNINMGDMQEALSEVNGSAMQVNTLTTPNEETKSVKDAKLAVKTEKIFICKEKKF